MLVRIRSTPRRLVLRIRPLLWPAYWTLGLAFLAGGVWAFATYGHSLLFTCGRDGGHGNCVLERGSLLRTTHQQFAAAELDGVRIDTLHGLVAGSTLVAHWDLGDVRLPLVEATAEIKDSLFIMIEDFVNDPQHPGFMIEEDTRRRGLMLGTVLLGAGLLCLVAIDRSACILDRKKGLATVTNWRWLIFRKHIALPLAGLRGVDTESEVVRSMRNWGLILLFKDGVQVRLTPTPRFTDDSVDKAAGAIRDWLQLS